MSNYMNQAGWDRVLRVALGALMLGLGWGGVVGGVTGVFLKVFGIVPFVTGLAGWCPLYTLLGIRTRGDATTHTS